MRLSPAHLPPSLFPSRPVDTRSLHPVTGRSPHPDPDAGRAESRARLRLRQRRSPPGPPRGRADLVEKPPGEWKRRGDCQAPTVETSRTGVGIAPPK